MKIKRIMLIKPGRRYSRMGFGQPLGLLYLISVLRQRYPGKYEIDYVEQALYDLTTEDIRKRFKAFNPDIVGFSAASMEAGETEEIARMVKSEKPECKTIMGGPHASVFYDWALKDADIDLVVIGEGEETFPELLETLERDEPLDKVKGLAFMREGKLIETEPRPFIEEVDSIPFPAWDLIDFKRYSVQITMNGYCHSTPWAMIFTSRACPYKCAYCHCIFGKKPRKRSVENVLAEIELLVNKYGVKELHIVDDIFNIDLARAKRICDEIVARGIKVKIAFPNGIRADMMDHELIHKLKTAGCYVITYAVETASPRLQKMLHKNLDLEYTRQVIEWTYEEGIIPQSFFMLGFPTETPEEIEMTIKYALETKLLRGWFFTVVVYPRTELLDIAKKAYPDLDFSNYDWFDLRYWSETPFYSRVTKYDGFKIQRDAYRRFFLRPLILLKIIWWFPKNMFLLRGIWWGLRSVLNSLYGVERVFRPLRKFLAKNFGLFPE
jgi:anaerobic magnesium-protoporphyrin IX monomethyl ester cyclase